MIWTVFMLCDGSDDDAFITWAHGHVEAPDAESAAHEAYQNLVGDLEPKVLEVIVFQGRHYNELRSRAAAVKAELNA